MSGSQKYKFPADDRSLDAFDYFLALIAKLNLITEECNQNSWQMGWNRYIKSRGYRESINE